ncbi:MAG: glycosyl transferase family 90 [Prolixibacteraceae bacterium]
MSSIIDFLRRRKHRNSPALYYMKGCFSYFSPVFFAKVRLKHMLSGYTKLTKSEQEYVAGRLNYYNKLNETISVPPTPASDGSEMVTLDKLRFGAVYNGRRSRSVYILDAHETIKFFSPKLKAGFLFGDITHVPMIPMFTKSRPIAGDNANSVVLKLEKMRHFTFLKDNRKFTDKKNMLIGRAFVDQPHRRKFWEMYFGHPMCDLGNINRKVVGHPEWLVSPIPIDDHLDYKFILCLEGNDVASNLKWVMSSNSLAVMPRPTYETWFMEGCLIPNVHYVEIKADYSDLEERLNYYINHPAEASKIINQAHAYISQFFNRKRERLIGLLVTQKYFICTGQIPKEEKIHPHCY